MGLQNFKQTLKNTGFLFEIYLRIKVIVRKLQFAVASEYIISSQYKAGMNKKLQLTNPQTYNEKINWLKLYWDNDLASVCADKFAVRDYVKQKGLSFLLNELIGVYEHVNEIDFDKLPEQFVLKATHGSGWNIICTDQSALDIQKSKKKMKAWLTDRYYLHSGEMIYKHIKPRIICETLIQSGNSNNGLQDYKIFCFNGKPFVIAVYTDRDDGRYCDFFDIKWNHLEVTRKGMHSGIDVPKPQQLENLIHYAGVLSEEFPHARVDFYLTPQKIYFGEITFFTSSGCRPFVPDAFDKVMGDQMVLPLLALKR